MSARTTLGLVAPRQDDDMSPRGTDEELRAAIGKLTAIIEAKNGNGQAKWTSWLPPMVTCGLILVAGVGWARTTEGDLRQQLALQQQQIEQLKRIEGEVGQLKTYNDNIRVQFAARGWVIDPASGSITKKGR